MKTTLLILSLILLFGANAAIAEEEERDSRPATVNSVTNSLGIRTDFVTTRDNKSYVCTTVPGSAGFNQTFCY